MNKNFDHPRKPVRLDTVCGRSNIEWTDDMNFLGVSAIILPDQAHATVAWYDRSQQIPVIFSKPITTAVKMTSIKLPQKS
jgi:hypothetical protein